MHFIRTSIVMLILIALATTGFNVTAVNGYGGNGVVFGSGGAAGYNSINTSTSSSFVFKENMGLGSISDSVKKLQDRLRSEGFFTYPTSTGFFGYITLTAVKAYQKAHNIIATGYVGVLTIMQLNK